MSFRDAAGVTGTTIRKDFDNKYAVTVTGPATNNNAIAESLRIAINVVKLGGQPTDPNVGTNQWYMDEKNPNIMHIRGKISDEERPCITITFKDGDVFTDEERERFMTTLSSEPAVEIKPQPKGPKTPRA